MERCPRFFAYTVFRERNSALLDELIKLAVTAKDLSEFERKLDKMG